MFFLSDRMFVFARISFSLDTFMKEAGVPCVLYSHKQQDIITSHNMFTKTNLQLDWLTWNESSTCDRRICVYTDNNHMIGMFCPNTDVGILSQVFHLGSSLILYLNVKILKYIIMVFPIVCFIVMWPDYGIVYVHNLGITIFQ